MDIYFRTRCIQCIAVHGCGFDFGVNKNIEHVHTKPPPYNEARVERRW